eukprot:15908620-Heterocapsa_arctica.AAC.1
MRPQHDSIGGRKVNPARQARGPAPESYQRHGAEAPENAQSQMGTVSDEGRARSSRNHFGRTQSGQ